MKIYGPLAEIKYSIIRAIAEKVSLINRGLPPEKQIINLTMGQNYIGDPTPVIKRISWLYADKISPLLYAPSLGTLDARESVANNFYRLWYGITLNAKEVMITDGGMGAIRNAMGAIIRDGDIVVIDPLTFVYALDSLRILGRKYKLRVLDADVDTFFVVPADSVVERLEEIAKNNPDKNIVYYTQFGFNPGGAFRSKHELRRIVEFIDDSKNIFLVNDIVYHLIRFDKFEMPLASYLSSEGKNIVDCDTLSKPFSLMGLRVGAMITRDQEIFDAAAKVQQYMIVSPNLLACEIWKIVSDPDIFPELKRRVIHLNNSLKENLEIVINLCKKTSLELVSPRQGTLYALIKIPSRNAEEFVDELIEKANVAIVPGTAFEVVPKYGKKFARITISFPKHIIEKAMNRIEEYMSSM